MIVNDLLVNGDAQINGQLYCEFNGYLGKASGSSIEITNAMDYKLMSLTLYGKSKVTNSVLTSVSGPCGFNITYDSGKDAVEYNSNETITLYGIPVDSGGNYVDSDGQSWICDTLELRADDTVMITRRCEYLHLNGSEEWSSQTVSGGVHYRYRLLLSKKAMYVGTYDTPLMISSRMSVIPSTATWNSGVGISIYSATSTTSSDGIHPDSGKYLLIYDSMYNTASSMDDFKSSLTSNPIDVVYALAEPYTEEISSMKGVLSSLRTSNGTTIITNTLNANMYLTYMKSDTLALAIEGSELGVLLRKHLANSSDNTGGSGGTFDGGNGNVGTNTGNGSGGSGSGSSGSDFVYNGSSIDVLDRIRIGGI